MHTQYFFVDEGGHRQTVEAVGHDLPEVDAVASFAFVVKTVDSVDGC